MALVRAWGSGGGLPAGLKVAQQLVPLVLEMGGIGNQGTELALVPEAGEAMPQAPGAKGERRAVACVG